MSNKDACKRYREKHRERYLKDKKRVQKAYSLRRKFGITLDDYDTQLELQNFGCAICNHVPLDSDFYRKGKSLAVDHDHKTGKIRGLLCDKCNRGLGHFNDDPILLTKAIAYLTK